MCRSTFFVSSNVQFTLYLCMDLTKISDVKYVFRLDGSKLCSFLALNSCFISIFSDWITFSEYISRLIYMTTTILLVIKINNNKMIKLLFHFYFVQHKGFNEIAWIHILFCVAQKTIQPNVTILTKIFNSLLCRSQTLTRRAVCACSAVPSRRRRWRRHAHGQTRAWAGSTTFSLKQVHKRFGVIIVPVNIYEAQTQFTI